MENQLVTELIDYWRSTPPPAHIKADSVELGEHIGFVLCGTFDILEAHGIDVEDDEAVVSVMKLTQEACGTT